MADPERAKSRENEGERGKRSVELPDAIAAEVRLLPTPMSNEENPGAGGELRAAITHGAERRNRTGTDSWGRPNRGRSSGEPTDPPSSDGSASSDEQHPDQLTISDGSTPASPSGCSDTRTDGSESTE
jgi:hypothetical protein